MSLPTLANWDSTKNALHQSLRVLGAARLLGVDPMPNELEYSLIPIASGVSTGKLSYGGELQLDYGQGAIIYERDGTEIFRVNLDGHNQTSLFNTVFDAFADTGLRLEPSDSKITETEPFQIDLNQGGTYAEIQWRMYGVLAGIKARMYGPQTPIALWAHGFDLSTIWFIEGMDEHNDPQMNIGFSPGTSDVGQPYFYFYAWPVPENLPENLPEMVKWNTSWRTPGGTIRYDQFANANHPEKQITDTLITIWQTASEMLKAKA